MTTSTSTIEISSADLGSFLYPGVSTDEYILTVTGPVDGVWTITVSDEISQDDLDAAVAFQVEQIRIQQNYNTLRERTTEAIPHNRDFLVNPAPTVEDLTAQVQDLTRTINALIMLRIGDYTDISGT